MTDSKEYKCACVNAKRAAVILNRMKLLDDCGVICLKCDHIWKINLEDGEK